METRWLPGHISAAACTLHYAAYSPHIALGYHADATVSKLTLSLLFPPLSTVLSSFLTSFHVASFLLSLLPPFYTLTICYFFSLLQIFIIFSPLKIMAFLQLFSSSIFFHLSIFLLSSAFLSSLLSMCNFIFLSHAPPSLFPVFNVFPSLKKVFLVF